MIIPVGHDNSGDIIYTVSADGIIMKEQLDYVYPILPPEFYRGLTVDPLEGLELRRLSAGDGNGDFYELEITLSNENTTFNRIYAVRPLALYD